MLHECYSRKSDMSGQANKIKGSCPELCIQECQNRIRNNVGNGRNVKEVWGFLTPLGVAGSWHMISSKHKPQWELCQLFLCEIGEISKRSVNVIHRGGIFTNWNKYRTPTYFGHNFDEWSRKKAIHSSQLWEFSSIHSREGCSREWIYICSAIHL